MRDALALEHRLKGSVAKRGLDFLFALLGVVFLSPLLAVIAIAVKLTSHGPIIFRQTRVGLNNRPFTFYKFRSMVEGAEHKGLGYAVAKNDDRITKIGKYLRANSLDELPQLFNVLKGDMSLIGPRPTIPSEVAKWPPFLRVRQNVRPGLTGWAQINGRNLLSWDEKLILDVWYVEKWSMWLDLKILLKTVPTLLSQRGLYGADGIVRGKE